MINKKLLRRSEHRTLLSLTITLMLILKRQKILLIVILVIETVIIKDEDTCCGAPALRSPRENADINSNYADISR